MNKIMMETKLWFASNPEYYELLEILKDKFDVSDEAFAFNIAVHVRKGDIVCHIHYPSDLSP
jgi:acid phosphatase class B